MDGTTGVLEFVGAAFAAIGAVVGVAWTAYGIIRRMSRMLPAVDRLHELFGESPIDELHRICVDTKAAVGEIEIRQRIAERHLAIGVYVTDTTGMCTWANDYLCESFGLDSTEMRDFGWLSAIAPADRISVHAMWTSAVEGKIPYEQRYRVEPKDGSDPWNAYTEAWPVRVRSEIVCYVGYVKRDETEG